MMVVMLQQQSIICASPAGNINTNAGMGYGGGGNGAVATALPAHDGMSASTGTTNGQNEYVPPHLFAAASDGEAFVNTITKAETLRSSCCCQKQHDVLMRKMR